MQTPAQKPAKEHRKESLEQNLAESSMAPGGCRGRGRSCLLPLQGQATPHAQTPALQTACGLPRLGSSPGPMLQNKGCGTLCSADGEGASSAEFCLCTDLSLIPSHAELGPTWVSPKASFPGPGTTGSPFFPALGRPASSHCGTAHCCSQAAAPVQGAGTDLSGAWEQARSVPSPREEEEELA